MKSRLGAPPCNGSLLTSGFPYQSILYHEILILLYRPFIVADNRGKEQQPISTQLQQSDTFANKEHPPLRAHEFCTDSSSEIIRLVGLFRDRFGLNHLSPYSVHSLMTASMMTAYNVSSLGASNTMRKDTSSLIFKSIRMLDELSQFLPCARRAVEIVTSLRREWQRDQTRLQKRKRDSEGSDRLSGGFSSRQCR